MDDNKISKDKVKLVMIDGVLTRRIYSAFYKHITKREACEPLNLLLSSVFNVKIVRWDKRLFLDIDPKMVYILDGIKIFANTFENTIQADIVIAQGYPAIVETVATFFAKMLKKNVIVAVKDTHWYWPKTFISVILWPIYRKLIEKADAILVPGSNAYKFWLLNGLPKSKVYLVHYYWLEADMKPCKEIPATLRKIREKFEFVFLYLGRLIEKRGLYILIEAFYELIQDTDGSICLILAGEGPLKSTLKRKVEELGISKYVYFIGAIHEDFKACVYKIADVFVYVPIYTTIPEEWPIPPLEALKNGVQPIVSSVVGSIPDLHPYVIVVREGDVENLKNIMMQCLHKRRFLERNKNMRIAFANSINYNTVYNELLNAILSTMRNRSR